jgi:hypothetical protein
MHDVDEWKDLPLSNGVRSISEEVHHLLVHRRFVAHHPSVVPYHPNSFCVKRRQFMHPTTRSGQSINLTLPPSISFQSQFSDKPRQLLLDRIDGFGVPEQGVNLG